MNDIDKLQEEIKELKQRVSAIEASPKNASVRVTLVDRNGFEKVEYFRPSTLTPRLVVPEYPNASAFADPAQRPWHDGQIRVREFRLIRRSINSAIYEEVT